MQSSDNQEQRIPIVRRRERGRGRGRRPRNRNRSRSRSRSPPNANRGSQSNQQRASSFEEPPVDKIGSDMRVAFLQFFGDINQQKGLVFNQQDRKKLRNQQQGLNKKNPYNLPRIAWKQDHHWQDTEQRQKIVQIIAQQGLQNLPKQVADVILSASYIFADEVTQEVYRILLNIIKIFLFEPNAALRREKVKDFMREVRNYRFFGYKFSNIYKLREENDQFYREAYEKLGLALLNEIIAIYELVRQAQE